MENKKKIEAFVKNLPVNTESYFQILDSSQTVTMRSGLVTLKKGKSVGEHTTSGNEEMLVILNGKGEVEIKNEEKFSINKGMIAYVPPNTVHNVINNNDEDLQYIYIVAKAE
ncbi:MAG: cupin domain-containing protein [Ignavibacteriae bacterium]|nr:cupin domain-containing protein [Ignavibacteriota bacterium]